MPQVMPLPGQTLRDTNPELGDPLTQGGTNRYAQGGRAKITANWAARSPEAESRVNLDASKSRTQIRRFIGGEIKTTRPKGRLQVRDFMGHQPWPGKPAV